jgi:hypothetical protein
VTPLAIVVAFARGDRPKVFAVGRVRTNRAAEN